MAALPAVAPTSAARVVDASLARSVAEVAAAVRSAGGFGRGGGAPRSVGGGAWWWPTPVAGAIAEGGGGESGVHFGVRRRFDRGGRMKRPCARGKGRGR